MKLFLSSMAISKQQAPYFYDLVGKPAEDITFALIENAADPERHKDFVEANRRAFKKAGLQPTLIDLRHYNNAWELEATLSGFDVVWLGGGNTFYLRWIVRESGLEQIILKLANGGTVYGGASAGAIIAGPTLKYFEDADDPQVAPETIEAGLDLTELVVLPHWQSRHYGPIMERIKPRLEKEGFKTLALADQQAAMIDEDTVSVID